MGDKSAIEWTDATWNPIVGCSVVSPGCANCYAMRRVAPRLAANPATSHYAGTVQPSKAGPVWSGRIGHAPERVLGAPLRWKRPRRIFVNSTGDLFHESIPDEWIDRLFAVMALCPQHVFQVLTKRSARMRAYFAARGRDWMLPVPSAARSAGASLHDVQSVKEVSFPLSHVWLGVSAEDQSRADERVPDLLATPAAVRFVSAEPLLGPIDFERIELAGIINPFDALRGDTWGEAPRTKQRIYAGGSGNRLDWIIVGGESGEGARPMHPAWARSIRDQCAAPGVPFFFKQWGEHRPRTGAERGQACGAVLIGDDAHDRDAYVLKVGKHRAGRLLDGVEHNAMPGAPS